MYAVYKRIETRGFGKEVAYEVHSFGGHIGEFPIEFVQDLDELVAFGVVPKLE